MGSVVSVTPMWSRQVAEARATDRFQKFQIMFEEGYQITTTYDATELDVYNAPGIPVAGQPFSGFAFAFAEQAKLNKISPVLWIASVSYSGEFAGLTGNGTPNSPVNAPPLIELDDVETAEDVDIDYNGLPFTNTFGDISASPVKKLVSDQTLYIKRNFLSWNSYTQARYRHATNSDTFFGWPPGTAKMMKLRAKQVAGAQGYWEVEAMVQFRYPIHTTPERAWWARYPNMGLMHYVEAPPILVNVKVHATAEDGTHVNEPVPLTETGFRAKRDSSDVFWIERQLYDSLPFNALGLL